MGSVTLSDGPASKGKLVGLVLKREALLRSGYPLPPDRGLRYSESPCLRSLPEGRGLSVPASCRGHEDGERVDIALVGTGADLGESAEEEEAEGSGPARVAEAETFTPPTSSGRIRMPRPTTRSWKGKEVEKMRWE